MFTDARHALVTGAAGAVGSALADALARRAPGMRLSLVDKDEAGAARVAARLGERARALAWDLARPDELPGAWERLAADGPPVDVLVNCAGVMELRTFAATPWSLGALLLDVDLVSPMRLMSLAVPSMRERRRGLVVNVASMAGLVPLRGSAYYGAAKAGLAMASEIARLELAPHGVHVVTVYPGPVASELERRARAQVATSWTARAIPTGDARALAERIARAAEKRQPRVIYPAVYAGAAEVLSVARRFTARFSPSPLE
jgi:short-subunit dehydrogenase